MEWIESTVLAPDIEKVQSDGRIRKWKKIEEADNRCLRVVLLEDGTTIHNAFLMEDLKSKHHAGKILLRHRHTLADL